MVANLSREKDQSVTDGNKIWRSYFLANENAASIGECTQSIECTVIFCTIYQIECTVIFYLALVLGLSCLH